MAKTRRTRQSSNAARSRRSSDSRSAATGSVSSTRSGLAARIGYALGQLIRRATTAKPAASPKPPPADQPPRSTRPGRNDKPAAASPRSDSSPSGPRRPPSPPPPPAGPAPATASDQLRERNNRGQTIGPAAPGAEPGQPASPLGALAGPAAPESADPGAAGESSPSADLAPTITAEGEDEAAERTEHPRPRLAGAARRYATIIEQTLAEFGAPARVVHAEVGPMLIRFGIVPGYLERPARRDQPARRERVRAARIVSRSNDLALALGVTSLRIEAPVPGKSYIGIEVPNPHPRAVLLPSLLEEPGFQTLVERGVLPLALGRDVAGQPILADLARLPHLLIAGATGAGKSVAVNALLGTLLRTRTRDEVRVIVVDPKRVEFTWLTGAPHLLAPVVTEPEQAVEVLGKVETEMAHRYDLLAAAGCRNRLAYNSRARGSTHPPLPALVVVIDELADLMMLAADDVERSICRVAQLGRAAGIHLVVATQRPSVDVITGLIKANLPARLAFAVSSLVDSRTILDTPGAERLLGRGDFLYLAPDAMRPVRGQGALARDSWLKQTVKAAREAVPADAPDPEAERFARLLSATQIADDRLYARARELAQQHPKVSASFLQRKLRVGYPKAEALVERLRADGVIADPDLDGEE